MTERQPELWVEGRDDQNTISHLLQRHGFVVKEAQTSTANQRYYIDNGPWLRDAGNAENLINGMVEAIEFCDQNPVGFVVDANDSLQSRWEAICDRLRRVDAEPPNAPVPAGTIVEVPKFKTRAGVWLMPDNQRSGGIEAFLRDLIDGGDPLIGHAVNATTEARQLGATFTDAVEPKAQLHAWLAWQKSPGRPYGVAMKAKYFLSDAPTALRFVAWFRSLFNLPS